MRTPQGRFEARRFRPNIVVEQPNDVKDFVENGWIDHTLAIGDEVRLSITGGCPRCVMTTLPQADLPKDPGLRRMTRPFRVIALAAHSYMPESQSLTPLPAAPYSPH